VGLSDIAKGALLLIGTGILAERFGAGTGLSGLGAGISSLVAAPGVGIGAGLTGTATGIRSIGESFGDIGRGLASIFAAIPALPFSPEAKPPGYGDVLVPEAGSGYTQLLAGGGGNVTGGKKASTEVSQVVTSWLNPATGKYELLVMEGTHV